jgi:hypothetical protein
MTETDLCVNKPHSVPVIFEPPCTKKGLGNAHPASSYTVLLPSDTNREPIKSVTVVLSPFVTYLLTLPFT